MSSSLHPNRDGPIHAMHEATWQRLVTIYGYAQAINICDGKDDAARADLESWRNLGRGRNRLGGSR
jgi:hypothetical protein